jgi:hypothetical protein
LDKEEHCVTEDGHAVAKAIMTCSRCPLCHCIGVFSDAVSLSFHRTREEHCVFVPLQALQGTHNPLNRNPGGRSKTHFPWAGIRIPFGEKWGKIVSFVVARFFVV